MRYPWDGSTIAPAAVSAIVFDVPVDLCASAAIDRATANLLPYRVSRPASVTRKLERTVVLLVPTEPDDTSSSRRDVSFQMFPLVTISTITRIEHDHDRSARKNITYTR